MFRPNRNENTPKKQHGKRVNTPLILLKNCTFVTMSIVSFKAAFIPSNRLNCIIIPSIGQDEKVQYGAIECGFC